jgi:ABC-type nitrate/sulfonate/bicarbonate transport system permease component
MPDMQTSTTVALPAGVVPEASRQSPRPGSAAERPLPEEKRSWLSRRQNVLIGLASVLVVLVVWQIAADAGWVKPIILPGPLAIADALGTMFSSPTILNDLAVSGSELALGFGLAVVVGLVLGVAMGWYSRMNAALDPFVTFLYNTPRVALMPLLIIWFGIGIWSKVAVVFLGAFFPIVMSTADGIRGLDNSWIRAARSFGASDWQLFRTVALPGAVPFILTGFRLGIGHALIGVVVGELVAAQHGIGLILARAGQTFQTPTVFAAIVVVAVSGLILNSLLRLLEKRFQKWKPSLGD